MRNALLLAGICALALGPAAPALATDIDVTGMVNLSWNDCGAAGTANATFACTTNGPAPAGLLVCSFLAPAGTTNVIGLDCSVDMVLGSVTALEPWWQVGTGGCRAGATTGDFDYASGAFASCTDYVAVNAFKHVPIYATYPNGRGFGANTLRFRGAFAIAGDGVALAAGSEYYALKITVGALNSTGAGSCPGCLTPACFVLATVHVVQPVRVGTDWWLSGQAPGGRDYVTWQAAAAVGSCATVPAKNHTWGRIKALYR